MVDDQGDALKHWYGKAGRMRRSSGDLDTAQDVACSSLLLLVTDDRDSIVPVQDRRCCPNCEPCVLEHLHCVTLAEAIYLWAALHA